eukprot:3536505-Rhodomonas_salina.3
MKDSSALRGGSILGFEFPLQSPLPSGADEAGAGAGGAEQELEHLHRQARAGSAALAGRSGVEAAGAWWSSPGARSS